MRFYPQDAPVPGELRTDEFLLRPLRATDCELDYDAVMSSADLLLVKSLGRWPRPGFTWDENLKDLQEHEADHLARRAFTFTVMNPDETECLGCAYLNPLRPALESHGASAAQLATVGDDEAGVHFWARASRLAGGLDARLFAALHGWLAREWAFRRVLFRANDGEARPLGIYEGAGLRPIIRLPVTDVPQTVLFYG
jgi:RimJ/RimL family protein N-acetyltransferase